MKTLYFLFLFLSYPFLANADIVKPTLVEISVYTDGYYEVEVRASIEALLTGINSQFKNTKESPNAQKYDVLREMSSVELEKAFDPFKSTFVNNVKLKLDDEIVQVKIIAVTIPEPGYTKVPRISLIRLQGKINRTVEKISWFYPAIYADNAVRVRQVDNHQEKWHWSNWQWLRNDQWSEPFSLNEVFHKESTGSIITTYTLAGFKHILPWGLDHILFIIGLFLLSTQLRPLFWQVTMFTVAHSITLSLAMLEIVSLPAQIVEPLIALSIAYIGIENIVLKKLKPSRIIVVFLFGLLHGMGFASMLKDFGMPQDSFVTALISFNVGVELGQILIIVLAFISIAFWFRQKRWYRKMVVIPASALISIIGLFWTYDRLIF